MLNISENRVHKYVNVEQMRSYKQINRTVFKKTVIRILLISSLFGFILLFFPWTQNINAKGYLTTQLAEHRPQTINSIIGGKIEKWYVKEGDFVKKGDTIISITEIKSEYFDPELLTRTEEQLNNKGSSVTAYENKLGSLQTQISTLGEIAKLKMQQNKNKLQQMDFKIRADSADLEAYKSQQIIAEKQVERTLELYDKGIKSLTELEQKRVKLQEMNAKVLTQQSKYLGTKNERFNVQMDIANTQNEYMEKIAKANSDLSSATSDKLDAQNAKSKLQNALANYSIRQGYYHVTAAQDGYVTKLTKYGIGEIIKDGSEIVTLMPINVDLAVEFYVDPVDFPLVRIGEEVRVQFDGYPAVVFSGWPNISTGTYSGKIYAMDNFISSNGKYRALAMPNGKTAEWPKVLRVGSGVKTFMLLNDVPVWYELWRKLNGFPPDYYKETDKGIKDQK